MNGLKKRDFYFGAILSVLLSGKHTHYTPSLISSEKSDRGRIYEFAVDKEPDFILLMAYGTQRQDTYDKIYKSWSFSFNDEQLTKIKSCIDSNEKIKIAYLCGAPQLNQSELAVMDNEDIINTVYKDGELKKNVTIRRDKQKQYYEIFRGKSPRKSYRLKAAVFNSD